MFKGWLCSLNERTYEKPFMLGTLWVIQKCQLNLSRQKSRKVSVCFHLRPPPHLSMSSSSWEATPSFDIRFYEPPSSLGKVRKWDLNWKCSLLQSKTAPKVPAVSPEGWFCMLILYKGARLFSRKGVWVVNPLHYNFCEGVFSFSPLGVDIRTGGWRPDQPSPVYFLILVESKHPRSPKNFAF